MARTALSIAAALLTACGGTGADATPVGECAADVNGCSVFTDLTATTATIGFTSFAYTPACAEVKVGQAVTFVGDFGFHPISQTCGPVEAITHQASGSSMVVTFTTPGTYGYRCDDHFGAGMVGAIEVVP